MSAFEQLLQNIVNLIKAFFGPILAMFGLDIDEMFGGD